jgi:hypothetical protein
MWHRDKRGKDTLRQACPACASAAGTGELDEGLRVDGMEPGLFPRSCFDRISTSGFALYK